VEDLHLSRGAYVADNIDSRLERAGAGLSGATDKEGRCGRFIFENMSRPVSAANQLLPAIRDDQQAMLGTY
jgi:hypothetical protein